MTRAQTPPRYGVMWDFVSLHQHPTGGERAPSETALFKRALGSLGNFYAHPSTIVWRLTVFPDGYPGDDYSLPQGANVSEYFSRGWCFTESCWSSLSKNRDLSLDLGRYDMKVVSRAAIVKQCTQGGGRRPPLLPDQFALEIDAKAFTNGKDDRPLVTRLYREYFEATMVKASRLNYSRLDWSDTEARQLARVLPELQGLTALDLSHNPLGPEGGAAIATALQVASTALKSINLRGNELGTEGWCAIFNALRDNKENKIESWDLSDQGINPEIVKALAEYISVSSTLNKVDTRGNNISGEAAQQLSSAVLTSASIEVFSDVPIKELRADSLTELNLRGKSLGPTEAMVLAALIEGSTTALTECSLILNNLDIESATMLAKIGMEKHIMLSDMKRDQTEVNFRASGLKDADAIFIASDLPFMTTLTDLNLRRNVIGPDGAKAIAEALQSGTSTITELNLGFNDIGPTGAKAIAEALQFGTSALKSINLRSNDLGTEGWCAIFNALRDNKENKIESWDLSDQGINPEIVKALAEYISVSTAITNLDLSFNQLCGIDEDGEGTYDPSGIQALAAAIGSGSTTVKSINLSNNQLCGMRYVGYGKYEGTYDASGIQAIADALKSGITRLAFHNLTGSSALKSIDLRGNSLGTEGWCAIFHALRDNKENKIESWDLYGAGINPEIVKALAEYISVSTALTECTLIKNDLDVDSATMLAKIGTKKRIMPSGMKCDQTEVDFSFQGLTAADGILVASDLPFMTTITVLNLAGNQLCGLNYQGEGTYTAEGINAICEVLKVNSTLKSIDLSSNILCGINPYNGKGTYDPSAIQALAAAISSGSTTLKSIDLRGNYIGTEGAQAVRDAVKDRSDLRLLM